MQDNLKTTNKKPNAEEALELLIAGNIRFYKDKRIHPNTTFERIVQAASANQADHAFATILPCSNPRVPFEIVIRNILSNAIKHHDLGSGTIEIKFNKSESNQIITITDDGPGIPPEMHKKVLEMFQTLKPRDDVEGSGMGLAMTKRIINHYHGELSIKSDGIRGTSFIINWPLPTQ